MWCLELILRYMHHITAPWKQRFIKEAAKRAGLSGICVFGKPGRILVEGHLGSVWRQNSRALLERRRAALASQPRRHARSQAAGAARIKPWMIPDGCPTAFGCHGHHGCPCHCPSRVAYIVLYMLYTLYGAASRFSNISSRIEVGFPVHSPGKDSWLQDSVALELFQAKKPNMKNYSPKLTKQKIQSNNIKLYVYIYIYTRCFIFFKYRS